MRSTILFLVASASFASAQEYVTLRGQVKWNGKAPPEVQRVEINARFLPEGVAAPLPTDVLVDAKSLGLRNVVVWIRPDNAEPRAVFPPVKVKKELQEPKARLHTVSMANFNYEPRIVTARAGDKISFTNNTRVPNNIKYDGANVSMNVLLKSGEERLVEEKIAWQWPAISFGSSIYPWMKGCVRVFDHPYYALTDGDGKFEIADVPAGKWRIVYWHEHGFHKGREGVLGFPLEVKPGKAMELEPLAFDMPTR